MTYKPIMPTTTTTSKPFSQASWDMKPNRNKRKPKQGEEKKE
jgi:hypothetical protein